MTKEWGLGPPGGSGGSLPRAGTAAVHVLHEGYVRDDPAGDRVGSSVTLILDAGRVIVVDPGMVADRDELIAALAAHGRLPVT
jgi:glyoxylase-like metal-dependent hydrolase (beta-lactamase superfamily II)